MRIVDFSTHLSGPMASHLLAEVGAEVIKVEHPTYGDGNRGMSPKIAGVGDFHVALNSGTTSLAASTRSPHWGEVVRACAQWADAVIVGTRPSDAHRRGMGFEHMSAANDRLIYCAISGYGLRGPWQSLPAHGQNVEALAGTVPVERDRNKIVTAEGWRSSGTTMAGVFAAMGVLAAMNKRDEVAKPQFLHVSLWHSAIWWKWRDVNAMANLGHSWPDYRDLGPRYSLYETSDNAVILACPLEKKFWERFCVLLGLAAEHHDHGHWDRENGGMDYGYDGEYELIAERIKTRPRDEWVAEFERLEIPFAPVLDVGEAISSPHADENDVLRPTMVNGQTARIVASPIQTHFAPDGHAEEPLPPMSSPPDIGEQSADILNKIGLGHLNPEAVMSAGGVS